MADTKFICPSCKHTSLIKTFENDNVYECDNCNAYFNGEKISNGGMKFTTIENPTNEEETISEAFEKDGGPFWYFTKHGVQPGSVPSDIEIETIFDTESGSYFLSNKVLTTDELNEFDCEEKTPYDEFREKYDIKSGTTESDILNAFITETSQDGNKLPNKEDMDFFVAYHYDFFDNDSVDEADFVESALVDFFGINYFTESVETLNEDSSEIEINISDIEKEVTDAVNEYLGEDDDYHFVEVTDDGETVKVEVRAELDYDSMDKLAQKLNKVVTKYDDKSYFDFETSGIINAYIRKDKSDDIIDETVAKEWITKFENCKSLDEIKNAYNEFLKIIDEISFGTADKIYDTLDAMIDKFEKSANESCKNESLDETNNAQISKLNDIAFVMDTYIKDRYDVNKINDTTYEVISGVDKATIEFDTNWSGWVYTINGKGPYSHNSYEYLISDLRDYFHSLSESFKKDNYYTVTYRVSDHTFSKCIVKAFSKEDARNTFKKTHKQFVISVDEISENELKSLKRKGMSVIGESTEESYAHMQNENTFNPLVATKNLKKGDVVYDAKTGDRLKVLQVLKNNLYSTELLFNNLEKEETFTQNAGNNSLWELVVKNDVAYEVDDAISEFESHDLSDWFKDFNIEEDYVSGNGLSAAANEIYNYITDKFNKELKRISPNSVAPLLAARQLIKRAVTKYNKDYGNVTYTNIEELLSEYLTETEFELLAHKLVGDLMQDSQKVEESLKTVETCVDTYLRESYSMLSTPQYKTTFGKYRVVLENKLIENKTSFSVVGYMSMKAISEKNFNDEKSAIRYFNTIKAKLDKLKDSDNIIDYLTKNYDKAEKIVLGIGKLK